MKRRYFLASAAALGAASLVPAAASESAIEQLSALEKASRGRLGVFAIDTGTGRSIAHRAGERFAMCSTFKVLAVSAILARADRGAISLDRQIPYSKSDLLEYAPVTSKHVSAGHMTLEALCEAAVEYSDNTAANLLLRALGGPQSVTQFARSLGDSLTTLNRTEPTLNTAIPGDTRDTTTPRAMARDLQRILLSDVLSAASRNRLEGWLVRCQTGLTLLRAGFPASWKIGDKTGMGGAVNAAGDSDTRNDVAIARPPGRPALIVAAYLTRSKLAAAKRDAVLASVARLVTRELG